MASFFRVRTRFLSPSPTPTHTPAHTTQPTPPFLAAYQARAASTPSRALGGWRPWASGPATPPPPGDGPNPDASAGASPASSSAAPAADEAELSDGGAPPSPDELATALAEQEAELVKARAEVRRDREG